MTEIWNLPATYAKENSTIFCSELLLVNTTAVYDNTWLINHSETPRKNPRQAREPAEENGGAAQDGGETHNAGQESQRAFGRNW